MTRFFLILLIASLPAYADDLPVVKVQTAKQTDIYDAYVFPVVLDSKQESYVVPEVDGIVKKVNVKIGDKVRVNQELMLLQHPKPGYTYEPLSVRSTISGTVAAIEKKLGSRVAAGDKLIYVVNHDELTMKFEVPESELGVLKSGFEGVIKFRILENKFPITISGISPVVSPATGTASGELQWSSKSKKEDIELRKNLYPGMIGKATFKLNDRKGILIPKDAILFEKKAHSVWTFSADKVFRKPIKLGKEISEQVEILSGIKEGDQIVVNRSKYLKEGEQVKLEKKEEEK